MSIDANIIVNLKTVTVEGVPAIMMGINIKDLAHADEFIGHIAEQFKLQRMMSPPDTQAMLITLVSPMPLSRFLARWQELVRNDEILRFFMSQMRKAPILRGLRAGVTLEKASLLEPVH